MVRPHDGDMFDDESELLNMIDWTQKNREFARQHTHNHSPEEIQGMRLRPGRMEVLAATLGRLGWTARRDLVLFHCQNNRWPSMLQDNEEHLAQRWYEMTPRERATIFPWSVCQANQANSNRDRKSTRERYPLLIHCMIVVTRLSKGEAVSCIRDYKNGLDFSGETVNHFGGCRAVLDTAANVRKKGVFFSTQSMYRYFKDVPPMLS